MRPTPVKSSVIRRVTNSSDMPVSDRCDVIANMESESIIRSQASEANAILNDDLEFWMTRLPAPLKDIPIIHLAIPGMFKSFRLKKSTNAQFFILSNNKAAFHLMIAALVNMMAHILNPLLSIKVPLKVAYKPSDWLQAAFRSTFIDKRGFRIWADVSLFNF